MEDFEARLRRMESALGLDRGDGPGPGDPARPVVWVVDDDPRVLDTLGQVLGGAFRVLAFGGGGDLRSRWPAEGADAAVLDIKMPDEDGLSVFRTIRERHPETPVLFYTAHPGDEETAERARTLGAAACLGKGCPLRDLEDALREAVRRRAAPDREESDG